MPEPSIHSSRSRGILGRVPLRRVKVESGEPERRRSVLEAYRLVSTIGQAEEGTGWEVEVTRALVVNSLFPNKERVKACGDNILPVTPTAYSDAQLTPSFCNFDTVYDDDFYSYSSSFHNNNHHKHHNQSDKIPHSLRAPFLSLSNTLGYMPSASSPTNIHHHNADKGKNFSPSSTTAATPTRPIITPRRATTASTTRSFSSIPPPKLTTQSGSSSLLAPPTLSVIEATPDPSPVTPTTTRRAHHKSDPETPSSALRGNSSGLDVPQIQKSWSSGSGKRKAEEYSGEADTTPPKDQQQKDGRATTFAPEPRTHRASASSHAPSSYRRKRARLSVPSSDSSNPPSRPASRTAMSAVVERDGSNGNLNAKTTGSWSSKKSGKTTSVAESTPRRAISGASSHTRNNSYSRSQKYQSGPPTSSNNHTNLTTSATLYQHPHGAPSRRSLSQASIPISALISPHAPSITHSGTFHMRDPRKPAPVQSTPWSLSLASPLMIRRGEEAEEGNWVERGGSPFCAWLFFIGFVVFPVWWASWFVGVPKTRKLNAGPGIVEKGVVLDDPQVEHDARSWRTRCRVMSGISVVTYIPFIVLIVVFAR